MTHTKETQEKITALTDKIDEKLNIPNLMGGNLLKWGKISIFYPYHIVAALGDDYAVTGNGTILKMEKDSQCWKKTNCILDILCPIGTQPKSTIDSLYKLFFE